MKSTSGLALNCASYTTMSCVSRFQKASQNSWNGWRLALPRLCASRRNIENAPPLAGRPASPTRRVPTLFAVGRERDSHFRRAHDLSRRRGRLTSPRSAAAHIFLRLDRSRDKPCAKNNQQRHARDKEMACDEQRQCGCRWRQEPRPPGPMRHPLNNDLPTREIRPMDVVR